MNALRKNELARCLTALAHALIVTSENTLRQNDGRVPPAIVADWMRANDLGDWGSVDVQDALDEVCAATAHNDFSAKIVWRKEWVGLQVYRDGFPRSVIGRIDGRGEQAHNAVVHWTGGFLPGVLPVEELRTVDDRPLTEYQSWFNEDWRGMRVTERSQTYSVVGAILGPAEKHGWVQVGWAQGCVLDIEQPIERLCRTDGGTFGPVQPEEKELLWHDHWIGLRVRHNAAGTIGTIECAGTQRGTVQVQYPGTLTDEYPKELYLADTDVPLVDYESWWQEEWRGVEVSPFGHPEVVGTVLGPWEHANWVQIDWVQGCEQPTNWHMCELQRVDGRLFYVL